jgi:hypothetical protein
MSSGWSQARNLTIESYHRPEGPVNRVHLEKKCHMSCTSGLAHERNAIGVASKGVNVQAHPLESEFLVKEAYIMRIQWDFICRRTKGS